MPKSKSYLAEKTVQQFIDEVSDQHYAVTGAVVALSAAQAAALAEACMQISLDNQVDKLDWQAVTGKIAHMAQIKEALLNWAEREMNILVGYPPAQAPDDTQQQRTLCDSAVETAQYCLQAVKLLQEFRPLAFDPVQEDLEITVNLLSGAAGAALRRFDSNLGPWCGEELMAAYQATRADLAGKINQLDAALFTTKS